MRGLGSRCNGTEVVFLEDHESLAIHGYSTALYRDRLAGLDVLMSVN